MGWQAGAGAAFGRVKPRCWDSLPVPSLSEPGQKLLPVKGCAVPGPGSSGQAVWLLRGQGQRHEGSGAGGGVPTLKHCMHPWSTERLR